MTDLATWRTNLGSLIGSGVDSSTWTTNVLDEALRDYIDRHQKERPRRHVMASFASSLDEFDSLYRELAK